MKKTLVSLMALAGVAFAKDDITLRYLLDFSSNNGSISNAAPADSKGSTAVTANGYVNWSANPAPMDGSSYAHPGTSRNWSIVSSTGINDGTASGVLNTTDGFTIMFNGYINGSVDNWKDFLSFTITGASASRQYKFEANDAGGVNVYEDSQQASPEVTLTKISRNTWYNYGVSVIGDKYTFAAIDTTGKIVSEATYTGLTGNLTGIYDVSNFQPHTSGKYYIDNVAVYDGALSVYNMQNVTKGQVAGLGTLSTVVVPEPTTATLSLLALCGLAARRRRK